MTRGPAGIPNPAACLLMSMEGLGPASCLALAGRLLASGEGPSPSSWALLDRIRGSGLSERLLSMPEKDLADLCREALGKDRGRRAFILIRKASSLDPDALARHTADRGISFVCAEDEDWPEKLRRIPDPPVCLFYRGSLPRPDRPCLAVIGSRRADGYGLVQARRFAGDLAGAGIQILSGLARGIDGAAGRAALKAGGASFAVLGSGPDICYPAENRDLYEALCERGGVLSEYRPGTRPRPFLFPARNRIIAGLSDAVLVVRASLDSGTMITTGHALDQGRNVFAVPGPVSDALSSGCHELIRQGAGIASSPRVLAEYFFGLTDRSLVLPEKKEGSPVSLTPAEAAVLQVLSPDLPMGPDQVREAASLLLGRALSFSEASSALMMLALKGLAEGPAPGLYTKSLMT